MRVRIPDEGVPRVSLARVPQLPVQLPLPRLWPGLKVKPGRQGRLARPAR
jgi:hypothetical protein